MKGSTSSQVEGTAGTRLPAQNHPPSHILVAEDDVFFRRLNTQVLSRSGYQVDAAANGAAAWLALKADRYDLLITDNLMPKLSGVELLRKLHAARMALPVILASGASPEKEFTQAPWLQPAAILLKPYTSQEMLSTVKRVLSEVHSIATGSQPLKEDDIRDNQPSQAGEPAITSCQRPTRSAPRILVVDEDSDLREFYIEALAGPGYHVDAIDDGAAAWKALKANGYNLLITEHEIPSLTGVELIKLVRAARMAMPIVLAAGRLPSHELARNPSFQLAATLSKPFTLDALLSTVQSVLRVTDSAPTQLQTH